jgi:hypothetical protein
MTMKNSPHPGLGVLQEWIEPLGLTITAAADALAVYPNLLMRGARYPRNGCEDFQSLGTHRKWVCR